MGGLRRGVEEGTDVRFGGVGGGEGDEVLEGVGA